MAQITPKPKGGPLLGMPWIKEKGDVAIEVAPVSVSPGEGIPLHRLYQGKDHLVLLIWRLPRHEIRCNFLPTVVSIKFEELEAAEMDPKEIATHFQLPTEEFVQRFFEQGLHHAATLTYSVPLPNMISTAHNLMKKWACEDFVAYYLPFETHQSAWL